MPSTTFSAFAERLMIMGVRVSLTACMAEANIPLVTENGSARLTTKKYADAGCRIASAACIHVGRKGETTRQTAVNASPIQRERRLPIAASRFISVRSFRPAACDSVESSPTDMP